MPDAYSRVVCLVRQGYNYRELFLRILVLVTRLVSLFPSSHIIRGYEIN
jgi:hypothetical protein